LHQGVFQKPDNFHYEAGCLERAGGRNIFLGQSRAGPRSTAGRLCLSVGIDAQQSSPLKGCAKDAQNMTALFWGQQGKLFEEGRVVYRRVLLNGTIAGKAGNGRTEWSWSVSR
jgi:hypothetical protein